MWGLPIHHLGSQPYMGSPQLTIGVSALYGAFGVTVWGPDPMWDLLVGPLGSQPNMASPSGPYGVLALYGVSLLTIGVSALYGVSPLTI